MNFKALDASQSTIQVEGIASIPIRGRPRAGRPARTTNTRRNQTVELLYYSRNHRTNG